jgi:F0F1-type ATP synthase assembly protein I
VAKPEDDRVPFAKAMEWTSRITGISLEMVFPALIGYWLDQRWGTHHVLLILGTVLGFVTALSSLVQLGRGANSGRRTNVVQRRDDQTKKT